MNGAKLYFGTIFIFFSSLLFSQTVSKTVNVVTAGTLSNLITSTETGTVINLTLSGNIDARDFVFMRDKITHLSVLDLSSVSVKSYTGVDGTYSGISISYPANEIPLCAFYNANTYTYEGTLTSIKLPTTITSIGGSAFYYCYNLSGTFTIPTNVKSIGDYALYGCSQLSAFLVESANTRYSSTNGMLFNKKQDTLFVCPSAKTGAITIPSTVVCIANSAFESCSGLTGTLTLPSTIKSIGSYAFYSCSGFTGTLTIPSTISYIGDGAFYGCSGITGSISIPKTVGYLGSYAFFQCNSVRSFVVDASNPYYASNNDVLFNKSQDTLYICPPAKTGVYTMPTTVKGIGTYAFYNCSNLTGGLAIPKSVGHIGSYAFYGTNQITSFDVDPLNAKFLSNSGVLFTKKQDSLLVCPAGKTGSYSIPNTVKAIGASAFYNCSNLTGSITIPSSVNYIGNYAFYGCNQLSAYVVDPSNLYFSSTDGVLFNKAQDSLWICPAAKSGSYNVPTSVKHIGTYAFYYCKGLTGTIYLPASLTTIGDYAFYGCSNLSAFDVNSSNKVYSSIDGVLLNQVQDSLFICPVGKSGIYKIPESIKAIDYSAFDQCIGLTSIVFPSELTSIGSSAFYYCTGLTELTLPKSTTTIGSGAFYGCSNLKQFGIQNPNPPVVDGYTFAYVDQTTCQLLVPVGALAEYTKSLYWKNFTLASESTFSAILKPSIDRLKVYSNGKEITVEGINSGEKVELYNYSGQKIKTEISTSNRVNISVQKGVPYLIKTKDKSAKIIL
ncbi:MAG: leucine-rich repeat domain-containing protein [Bacteroidales bacterium]|nr:leucine-rich repeat domain-containing protein [Bacteroidales bacterium]